MMRNMPESLGVIAEDDTDVDVVRVVMRRLRPEHGIKKFAANGSGKLVNKAAAWFAQLYRIGCNSAVLLHDLDRNPANGQLNDEGQLRERLLRIDGPHGLVKLICIPVEELEAWFFSDPSVMNEVCGRPSEAVASPHLVKKPKEKLMALSRGSNRKERYNTNANARLAEKLDLDLCAQRCPSFRELKQFIERH